MLAEIMWLITSAHQFGAPRQNRVEPIEDRRPMELCAHRPHALAPLIRLHLERGPDSVRESRDVERVDQHRLLDLFGGPGETTQHEHSVFVDLTGDELLRYEVHAILKRRHKAEICRAVDGGKQLDVNVLVDEYDRLPVYRSEALVDVAHAREDFRFQILIRHEAAARWRRDDDHREAAAQFRRLGPEPIERPQPLGNS